MVPVGKDNRQNLPRLPDERRLLSGRYRRGVAEWPAQPQTMYKGTRQIAVFDWSTILSKAMLVSLFGRVKRAVSADRPAHTVSGYSAAAGFSAAAAAGAAVVLLLSGTAGVAGVAAGAGAGLGLGAAGGLTAG